jgi:hypothetical protein
MRKAAKRDVRIIKRSRRNNCFKYKKQTRELEATSKKVTEKCMKINREM